MTESRNYRMLVYSLFLLSGVSGLIYQIVWTRMLVLVFGNTMLATSTVLSAFMGGLAAGSYVLGKYIDRSPRPLLRVYALLEAGIGVFALLFPLVLDAATPLYAFLYNAGEGSAVSLNLIRFLICFLIIGAPTFLMGGTLPVLIKRFTRAEDTIGFETGFLYGLNTIGAVLGTFACGYFLLRVLGMQHTTWIAVAINLGVAAVAYLLGKDARERNLVARPYEDAVAPADQGSARQHPWVTRMVLLGIGISGFCALAYEVFWTRMLNLFLHNNIYSFTAILGTFLIGIALGSLLYARFLSRSHRPIRIFVLLQLGIGLISYATPFLFKLFHQAVFNNFDETMTLVKTGLIMLPPTIMMGIAVPLAIQICRQGVSREGTSVGTVYAVNTVGAIFGAFLAGFVILPELGLLHGVLIVASLNLVAGALPLFAVAPTSRRPLVGFATIALIAVFYLAAPPDLFRSLFQAAHPHADIVYYKEGRVANVLVYDFNKLGYKDFHLNAVNEASSRLWHVQLFKLLGLLPTVVHDQPDDALMIAFGAGMSAGATATNVKSLDCVDLNPDIRGIADAYTRENLDVINRPNFRQVVNDGRNALLLDPRQYSLIISDATNPKMFDSWTLYSQEFYQLVKSRLKPDGIFCQWALVPLPADAIKVIFNTFRSVFPHMSVWVIHGSSQILMLGTPERLDIDYDDLAKRLEPLYQEAGLAEFGIETPEKFLSYFTLGEDGLNKMLAGFDKVSTDDLPYAQFIIEQDSDGIDNCLDLVRYQESAAQYVHSAGGLPPNFARNMPVYEDLGRRLNIGFLTGDPARFAEAQVVAAQAGFADANVAHHLDYCPEKIRHFREYLKTHPDDLTVRNTLATFYLNGKQYAEARQELETVLAAEPEHPFARINLAHVQMATGEFDRAIENLLLARERSLNKAIYTEIPSLLHRVTVLRKLAAFPDSVDVLLEAASAFYEGGELLETTELLKRAISLDSSDTRALSTYAWVCERHEFTSEAAATFAQIKTRAPGDAALAAKAAQITEVAQSRAAQRDWLNSRLVVPQLDSETAPDEAAAHPPTCDQALKLCNETNPDGSVERAKVERAAELYVRSTETDPEVVHAYVDAGILYEMLGDYDRAQRLWSAAARLRPDLEFIARNAERLAALSNASQNSNRGCERAALLKQLADLTELYYSPELALYYLQQALTECPDDAQLMQDVAQRRARLGEVANAAAALPESGQ